MSSLHEDLQHSGILAEKQLSSAIVSSEVARVDGVIIERSGIFGPLLSKLFESGVEGRGVERVLEDERDGTRTWNIFFFWTSVNLVLSNLSVGILAQDIFSLTFPHAIAAIVVFGFVSAVLTSLVATLGPKTGLRTMIIVRFSSGYLGGIVYSVLNVLSLLGFAVTCIILGGQTLASVNAGSLPLVVGVIIVSICSLIPCFIGYNVVHTYERYVWIPLFVVMFFLWGLGGHAGFGIQAQKSSEESGRTLTASMLSFGGIVFGTTAGWATLSADYNCRLPVNTSATKVFFLTFFGIYIPTSFAEILGAALMTITKAGYPESFESGSLGGLLGQVLMPWKSFGKFLLVVLALSVIANNVLNTYSVALSIQALGRPFGKIPRICWTVVGWIIYTVAGVAGREHFAEILSNFLAILGYWSSFFILGVLEEHYIFRRQTGSLGGYNLDDWDTPGRLPVGIAGILAGCFGALGAIIGMSEVWYTGPIGKIAGNADVGCELAIVFSAITYPPLRWLEIRIFGR
ncbi:cytosine-purine permease [Desarmillaria tabescens]|uniref:Cytosine-purine permease n=1 Tax=Armillaria tabescens TaxID=1929756 RepID=A0AA39N4T8_ARMTA|nr:cytosine-purine permease [Desarmillaria tabescens]KAK0457488.1 cytosine-purine permease [Desarmillaria tabescens]